MNREQRLAAWLEGELDADGHEELLRELSSDVSYAREAAAQLQMKRLLGSVAMDVVRWPSKAVVFLFLRAWKPIVRPYTIEPS